MLQAAYTRRRADIIVRRHIFERTPPTARRLAHRITGRALNCAGKHVRIISCRTIDGPVSPKLKCTIFEQAATPKRPRQ